MTNTETNMPINIIFGSILGTIYSIVYFLIIFTGRYDIYNVDYYGLFVLSGLTGASIGFFVGIFVSYLDYQNDSLKTNIPSAVIIGLILGFLFSFVFLRVLDTKFGLFGAVFTGVMVGVTLVLITTKWPLFKREIRVNKTAKIWRDLGDKAKDPEKKVKYYDKAIEINPEYANTWYNKGVALLELGKNGVAIRCFDKVLEIDPELADAWDRKGIVLSKLGRYDEAIKCFDKELGIDPHHADAWNYKGIALSELGKDEEALSCFDKALEINPNQPDVKSAREHVSRKKAEADRKEAEADRKEAEEQHQALEGLRHGIKEAEKIIIVPESIYKVVKNEEYQNVADATRSLQKLIKLIKEKQYVVEKLKSEIKEAEKLIIVPESIYKVVKNEEYQNVANATRSLQELIRTARPELSIELDRIELDPDKWQKAAIAITNTGKAHASNVNLLFSDNVEVKGIKPISIVAGEKEIIEIDIKPLIAGNVPLEITAKSEDEKGRKYEDKHEFWIKVSEAAPETATISEEEIMPELSIKQETDFDRGFIRFKISLTNTSSYMVNDVALDFIIDETILRLDSHKPDHPIKNNKIILGNITSNSPKTVSVYFDPMICSNGTEINCQINYRDAKGHLKATFLTEKIEAVCPPIKTESDLNTGRLKGLVEMLPYNDSRTYQLQAGFDTNVLKTLSREVVQKHDLKHIRTISTKEGKICEILYYGKNKTSGHETVIIVIISSEIKSIELFTATQTKEMLTELLPGIGRELKTLIETRTAGKGNVQVINVSIEDSVVTRPEIRFGTEVNEK